MKSGLLLSFWLGIWFREVINAVPEKLAHVSIEEKLRSVFDEVRKFLINSESKGDIF
jgi:hypothetical protein